MSYEAKCPKCGADVDITDGDLMGVPDTDEAYCDECDTALFVEWQPMLVVREDDEKEAPPVTYRLVRNHLNKNASYDGYMFEAFDHQAKFVGQQVPTKVWTLLDCDGELLIRAGWHFANRLGYFVTEESWFNEHECYDWDTFQPPHKEGEW